MTDFGINVLTAPLGKTYLFSVGQAGYIIKSKSGQLLAIDIYLSDCVERLEGHVGFKRLLPKILSPFDIALDCIITTHPHWDHYDVDSIPELMSNNKTQLYASVDCEELVKSESITNQNIDYVKPGDHKECGDFSIDFINCDHGTGAPDAVGVIVTVDGKRILEVGDSCLRLDRTQEYLSAGSIDVMIAPINGVYGNLNEQDCVDLCKALNPRITVPCHYGMFASHGGNPGKFFDIITEQCPDKNFVIMAMGEKIEL